ncbi:MAG: polysaccharide deacetylase family protein [Verrucomicrobia bacterium]|nr:polysaccharide deacetylase family protein [Verrucomicrobiota bacterium]
MQTPAYLTISVDDGHPLDMRTAELLDRHGLKATFYVPAANREHEVMAKKQVRELSRRFEMGGHTYNHLPLASLPDDQARAEIRDGKHWLEDVTGQPARAFCYPQGKFTARTVELVKKAGFLGARTCFFNRSELPRDLFRCGVSTHAYSHSAVIQVRHALLEANFKGVVDFFRVHKAARDWELHFQRAVAAVEREGGVAHLYFHSWEIDDMRDWAKLARAFEYAASRKELTRVTNGELFAICRSRQATDGSAAG